MHEDNWEAVLVFCDLSTQWRVVSTMAGAFHTGLDYTAAIALCAQRATTRSRRAALFDDVRLMEGAALLAWSEQRAAAAAANPTANAKTVI